MSVTSAGYPDLDRVRENEVLAGSVFCAEEKSVDGGKLANQLNALGYRIKYPAA